MESRRGSSNWSLKSRISNLLGKESCSDVEFLVGSSPGQRYLCHKIILAAGSEVFQSMFYGALQQKKYPVRVPDVTPKGFELMLQYLYSDAVSLQDESEAFETAYPAKKYLIGSLFEACESFLLQNIVLNPENVLSVHGESSFLGMDKLRDRCLRYVSRNARKVFLSKSHVTASEDTFQDVLELDLMDIESEREIVEALWLWGEQRCQEEGVKCSVANVRRFTGALLKHVRFLAMGMEELVDTLETCSLLDTSDELALLWNLAMPGSTKKTPTVPSGICMKSKTRSFSNSSRVQLPGQYHYDGNMTSFLIENHQIKVDITVTSGSPITVIGIVIAFKPIPCYSCSDRSLEVEISVVNPSTGVRSGAKSRLKTEEKSGGDEVTQSLLLDDYVVIEKEQTGLLTIRVSGEGVRLMKVTEETLTCDLGKSEVHLKVEQNDENTKQLMPVKELMIV